MSLRVCSEVGCPEPTTGGRCPTHRRERERARGSSTARGYGVEHQRERARWSPLVAQGVVLCFRCGEMIPANAPWDLGHDDDNRSRYTGPEHVGCNRSAPRYPR